MCVLILFFAIPNCSGQERQGLRRRDRGYGRADVRLDRPLEALDLQRSKKNANQRIPSRQGKIF